MSNIKSKFNKCVFVSIIVENVIIIGICNSGIFFDSPEKINLHSFS